MKNHKKYIPAVKTLFTNYLNNVLSNEDLFQGLVNVEYTIKTKEYRKPNLNKNLWFKFHKHDTLATTPYNIIGDLEGGLNKEFIIECMELAINPTNNDFKIYFS